MVTAHHYNCDDVTLTSSHCSQTECCQQPVNYHLSSYKCQGMYDAWFASLDWTVAMYRLSSVTDPLLGKLDYSSFEILRFAAAHKLTWIYCVLQQLLRRLIGITVNTATSTKCIGVVSSATNEALDESDWSNYSIPIATPYNWKS